MSETTYVLKTGEQQRVSTSVTSAQSSVLGTLGKGRVTVRLFPDVRTYIEVGLNPTATTNSTPLRGGTHEYIDVPGGHKIAAVLDSSTGFLSITPSSKSGN